jgi:DNA-binding GntR family transcriptional regulator
VYETLRERLLSGEYPQASRLSVETIRGEFTVSKQPIMEALRLLSADGLVEIIPQVGCITLQYSDREVGDFFTMFAATESAITAAAAERRTSRQIDELEALSARIGRLPLEPDPRARSRQYLLDNRQFHAKIHEMADSRVMADTSRRMWDLSDYLISTARAPVALSTAMSARHGEHEVIRAAITDADADAARAAMSAHILETVSLIRAG